MESLNILSPEMSQNSVGNHYITQNITILNYVDLIQSEMMVDDKNLA